MTSEVSSDERRKHAVNSTLREKIIEHLFVGDLLRRLWQMGILDAEILESEFDAGGYDLVLTHRQITRHIQVKVSRENGARSAVSISKRLAEKPSGCVVWIGVNDDLVVTSYRWFGNPPGQPLPAISEMAIARHTKGDAQGSKNERIGHRVVSANAFRKIETLDLLLITLLGADIC